MTVVLPLLSPSSWSLLSRVFVRSSLVCCPALWLLASMARWTSVGLLALSGVPVRSLVLLPVPILGLLVRVLSYFLALHFAALVLVLLSLPLWSLSSRSSPPVRVSMPPPESLVFLALALFSLSPVRLPFLLGVWRWGSVPSLWYLANTGLLYPPTVPPALFLPLVFRVFVVPFLASSSSWCWGLGGLSFVSW